MFDFIYDIFYYIAITFCRLVDYFYMAFEMFAGVTKVNYDGKDTLLLDVFFSQPTVNTVYWGMALIGVVLTIAFTIMAVIKKIFDSEDKVKNTLGGIIGSSFKALLIIFLMNFIVLGTISASNVLIQQITYLFDNASILGPAGGMEYSDKQFATMARCINTIGNYSLSTSRGNRYNVNQCFNEIRPDLLELRNEGVFAYDYRKNVAEQGESWQSVLAAIAAAASLDSDQYVNDYNESLTLAMENAFNVLDTNTEFYPLKSYKVDSSVLVSTSQANLGAILFLSGSLESAYNGDYNGRNASITDIIRRPFMVGDKDYTDLDEVTEYFELYDGSFSFLIIILSAVFLLWNLLAIVVNCVARIFNLLLLYIVAPPFAATMPVDDGAKFKQWTTSFIIQAFSLLGTIITMRLFMLCIPIVMSGNLHFFEDPIPDLLCRVILLIGFVVAAKGAGGLITGILAEQAGMNAIRAADIGGSIASPIMGFAGKTALGAPRLGFGAGKLAGKATWGLGKATARGIKGAIDATKGPDAKGGGSSGGSSVPSKSTIGSGGSTATGSSGSLPTASMSFERSSLGQDSSALANSARESNYSAGPGLSTDNGDLQFDGLPSPIDPGAFGGSDIQTSGGSSGGTGNASNLASSRTSFGSSVSNVESSTAHKNAPLPSNVGKTSPAFTNNKPADK